PHLPGGAICCSCRTNRSDERRPVDLITQIDSNGPDRCAVTKAQSHGMREIIQLVRAVELADGRICGIENRRPRIRSKRDTAQAAVYVSTVIEERPAQRCPEVRKLHRKSKFLIQNQQGLAPNWESRHAGSRNAVARSCLVQRKAAQRRPAAGEKSLGQWD